MSVIEIPGGTASYSHSNVSDSISIDGSNHDEEINSDVSDYSSNEDGEHAESDAESITEKYYNDPSSAPPPDVRLGDSIKTYERYKKSGKSDAALKELVKGTVLSLLVYGPKHYRYAESYANLALGYLDLKGPAYAQQADQHAEFSRSILTNVNKSLPSSEEEKINYLKVVINTHFALARSKGLLKKFTEGETAINKAINTAEELNKLSLVTDEYITEVTIKLHSCAAKMALKNDKHAMAMSHFETALRCASRFYGEEAVELIPLYQAVGQAEQAKGKHANHERAVQEYVNAHEIAVKVYPDNSLEVAESQRALAIAYSKSGKPEAEISAESHLNSALATYISIYGPCHSTVCQVQRDLACLYIRTNREMEGISLAQKNIKIESVVYGEYSDEVLQTYKLLGSTYLSLEMMEEALKVFEKCYAIEEFVFGKSSKRARDTKSIIDTIAASPAMASKQSQSELKSRPRFNNLSRATGTTGVFNHV